MNSTVTIPGVGEVSRDVAMSKYGYGGSGVYNGTGGYVAGNASTGLSNSVLGAAAGSGAQWANPPSPISADGLSSPVTNPIPPTTPQPPSVIGGHNVPLPTGTTVDANGQATTNPPIPTPEKSAYQKAIDKISGLGDILATKGDVTQKLQEEQQLAQKREQAIKDYNAYNQKKIQYQQRIEAMHGESTGGTLGGQNQAIDTYSRQANADLANLAVQTQASQGLVTAAEQTIKAKLDAQFQPVQDQVDFYTKFIQLNQNDLSESDQLKLQAAQQQMLKDKENTQTIATNLHNSVLESAPSDVRTGIFSAFDKINHDYVAGKITALDAQNQMYQAAGQYGKANSYQSVQSFDPTTGLPVFTSFNTKTGQYGASSGGASSQTGTPTTGNQPSSNPNAIKNTYEQFGLLSNTNFDPAKFADQQAYNYLTVYLTEGRVPNASDVGIRGYGQGASIQFNNANARARNLYYTATGQPLPTPQIIANNIKLINTNNDFANRLATQEQTVRANVDLSLANMTKNGLNSSSFRPLNGLIDTVKDLFNDPAVGQFLSQNSTIQNELGSLLAVKNASGTTVYDKLQSAGLITSTDTPANIQQKVKTLLAEADNFKSAIGGINGSLYQKIDPLQINPDNPNRQSAIDSRKSGGQGGSVTVQGRQFNVGQVYEDATGARWVFDANGKPTKQ